jgi:hypothetical protein
MNAAQSYRHALFWLQDREAQEQFKYHWDKELGNLADTHQAPPLAHH